MTRQTQAQLDATGYSLKVPEPMLDPEWTPQRGYSHAANLVAILDAHAARKAAASRGV